MSQMEIERVLAQIRSLAPQMPAGVGNAASAAGGATAAAPSGTTEFAKLLRQGVDQVNQTEQKASDLSAAFDRGTPGVELPQVMLEMQKASVSFHALNEVRNRLVSAYQDIMNMQL